MNIGHGREEEEEKQNILALYRQFQWNLKLPLAKIGLSNIAAQALIACYVLESGSPCSHSFPTVLMNSQICLLPSGTLQSLSYLLISLCSFHPTAEFCLSSVSCFVFTVFSFLLPFTRSGHKLIPQSPKHYSLKNKLLQRMGHNRCKTSSERHSRASIKVKINHWICQWRGHAFLDCACQLILGHFLPKDCFMSLFSTFKAFFSQQESIFFSVRTSYLGGE